MHPLLWLISGTLYVICLLTYYAILSFGKAKVKLTDIWFVVLQFLICGATIFALFFHTMMYFELAICIAIVFAILTLTDSISREELEFFSYLIIVVIVAVFAFFLIPLFGFIAYFKLDDKGKRK